MSPPPLRLTLIRHAATAWNDLGRWQGLTDTPIGPNGEAQARALAAQLSPPYDLAFSSDLSRAVQTAELALPGHPLILDVRLREYALGELEGHSAAEMQAHPGFAAWQADPWHTPAPGGQSLSDLAGLMRGWAEELPDGARVVAFSHSIAIRTLLVDLFGLPLTRQPNYPIPYSLRVGHRGRVELERGGGKWGRVGRGSEVEQ